MAATEGIASGDPVSANYHLAWYRTLAMPSVAAINRHLSSSAGLTFRHCTRS
ncbi:hypothetical protein MAHJHV45_47410 [Mycobacterium avium subsp. hominissuis]